MPESGTFGSVRGVPSNGSSYRDIKKEVVLERRLAQRSSERWTCQMSTSSGLRPGVRDSRRAIDIVQHIQKDEYRFIELKVGSD